MQASTLDDLWNRYRTNMAERRGDRAAAPYLCPVSEYSSCEQLADERRLLFREEPLVVALSADVASPSSAYSVDLDGVPLLVLRDKAARARVFVNACRHRGTRLFEGRSKVPATLVCPYHAWCYRLDGSLSKRPQAEPCYSGVDPATLGLRELPSDESLGLIVARLVGDEPVDVDSWAAELAPDLAAYGLESYHHIDTQWTSCEFNWKVTTQPVAGLVTLGSHAPVVHRRVRRSRAWRSCLAPVCR